jgi:hypothetical protein
MEKLTQKDSKITLCKQAFILNKDRQESKFKN